MSRWLSACVRCTTLMNNFATDRDNIVLMLANVVYRKLAAGRWGAARWPRPFGGWGKVGATYKRAAVGETRHHAPLAIMRHLPSCAPGYETLPLPTPAPVAQSSKRFPCPKLLASGGGVSIARHEPPGRVLAGPGRRRKIRPRDAGAVAFATARERQSKSPAVDSSGCRRDFGFSRRGRSAVCVSNACHRSARPVQNALSAALRAAAARRRHSSARRRNSSKITSRPFADPALVPVRSDIPKIVSNLKHLNG
jgi:hypothetical protein